MSKPEHDLSVDPHGEHGLTVRCICGWNFWHKRLKVCEKAGMRHLLKKQSHE